MSRPINLRQIEAFKAVIEHGTVVNVSPTLCEFVAAGVGVSLVHPLIVSGLRDKLAIRRFVPQFQLDFQVCGIRDSLNARLVNAFIEATRETAAAISRTILSDGVILNAASTWSSR